MGLYCVCIFDLILSEMCNVQEVLDRAMNVVLYLQYFFTIVYCFGYVNKSTVKCWSVKISVKLHLRR